MKYQILKRSMPLAVAIGLATATVAQEPEGNADANDPAANQTANPAENDAARATRNPVPAVEPYLPLTVDRFNRLDEDKDGALSAAELEEDDTLNDRFEEMDADRNREIDPGEFRGYQPE
ncbi:MAG: hypothetical protein ACREVN_13055 [Gammaproteobacteria bacterium]